MWRYKLLKVGKLQKTKGPTKDVTYSVFEREIDIASYKKKKNYFIINNQVEMSHTSRYLGHTIR